MADLLLWPAELMFRTAVAARNAAFDGRLLRERQGTIPVISVGNLSVGGAGKTPLTAWVGTRLTELGYRPAVVMRGYGADEVMVHRALNPDIRVYTAARRSDGVEEAAREGANVAVLDDAFQHRAVRRDLDIVLIAAESWREHPRLLPRGPWREGLHALRRADVIVITRKSASHQEAERVARRIAEIVPDLEPAICHLAPARVVKLGRPSAEAFSLEWLRGKQILVVTSIADPGALVAQLEQIGAGVSLMDFPDHHSFTDGDIQHIRSHAGSRPVVMTLKDAVKIGTRLGDDLIAMQVEQRIEFESGEAMVLDRLRAAVA